LIGKWVSVWSAPLPREKSSSAQWHCLQAPAIQDDDTSSLAQAMTTDKYADGRPVWTPLVAISLLVWFVLAMQCMSTIAIVRRETGAGNGLLLCWFI